MYLTGPTCQVVCLVASTALQVAVTLSHLSSEDRTLFLACLCLILAPHCLVNLASLLWAYGTVDWGKKKSREGVCVVAHILQGGMLWRYGKLIFIKDDKDLRAFVILRLIQSSLQDGPFVVLTGSVLLSQGEGSALGGAAAAVSLLSLSVAYTCPGLTKPSDNPVHQSISGTTSRYLAARTLHFISHLFLLGARTLAAICFVSAAGYWIFLTVGLHFCTVGCFVFVKLIQMRRAGKKGQHYCLLMLQLYDTIDLIDFSRAVKIFFYTLVTLENATITFFWLSEAGSSLRNIAISVTVFCSLAMGLIITVIREKCSPLRSNLPEENRKPEDKRRILVDKSPGKTRAINCGHTNPSLYITQDDFSQSEEIINASTPKRRENSVDSMSLSSPTSPIFVPGRRGLSLGDTPAALQDSGYLSRVETPPLTDTDIEGITCVVDMGPLFDIPQVDKVVGGRSRVINRCHHQKEGSREEMCLECQVDIFFISGNSCPDYSNDLCLGKPDTQDIIQRCEITKNPGTLKSSTPLSQPWLPQETTVDFTTHSLKPCEEVRPAPPSGPSASPTNRAWADFTSTSSDSSRPCHRRFRRLRSTPRRTSPGGTQVVPGCEGQQTHQGEETCSDSFTDTCSLTFCDICGHSSMYSEGSTTDSDWDETSQDELALTWPPSRRVLLGSLPQESIDPTIHVSEWLQNVSHEDPGEFIRRDSMQRAMAEERTISNIKGLFPRALETKTGKSSRGNKLFKVKGKSNTRVKGKGAKHILLRFCSFSRRTPKLPQSKNRPMLKSVSESVDFTAGDTFDVGKESCV